MAAHNVAAEGLATTNDPASSLLVDTISPMEDVSAKGSTLQASPLVTSPTSSPRPAKTNTIFTPKTLGKGHLPRNSPRHSADRNSWRDEVGAGGTLERLKSGDASREGGSLSRPTSHSTMGSLPSTGGGHPSLSRSISVASLAFSNASGRAGAQSITRKESHSTLIGSANSLPRSNRSREILGNKDDLFLSSYDARSFRSSLFDDPDRRQGFKHKDVQSVASAFLEKYGTKEDEIAQQKASRSCRHRLRNPWCRACLFALIFFVVSTAIITPIMFKILIPKLISDGFSAGTGMSTRMFTMTRLSLLQILNEEIPQPASEISTNMAHVSNMSSISRAGGADFDIGMWNTGYEVPLGIPVSVLGPSTWTMSIARDYATSSGKSPMYPPIDVSKVEDGGWFPVSIVYLPGNLDIQSGNLTISMDRAQLRVPQGPPPTSAQALEAFPSSGERGKVFPLGISFVRGVCRCVMSGDSRDVPRVLIEAKPDFKIGPLLFPGISVSRVFDIGRLMVDSGFTFTHSKSTASSGAEDLGVTMTVTNLTSAEKNVIMAGVSLQLKEPSPFDMTFRNLFLRLNISTTPIATITIPEISSRLGDKNINFSLIFRPIPPSARNTTSSNNSTILPSNTLLTTFSTLLFTPSSDWVLGIDSVTILNERGFRDEWVAELLDEVWLQFPFRVLGGETGLQAGVWIMKILESLVSSTW
ncbi:hypothetical protein HDU67_001273 [Dinochytrium kinnereticum]|nr:hypothetical protein HDU67_001273 [Dinochytrium kinnereticum]